MSTENHRFGFNGKEKDPSISSLTQYDYGFRIYNPAIGRFLSVDPLTKDYPWFTPYQFTGNNPIKYIDLDGLEPGMNPDDPTNQDNRNPTSKMNEIYSQSGGDQNFVNNYSKYISMGSYTKERISGLISKDDYISDSENADKYNIWVNNTWVFQAYDYAKIESTNLSNILLGSAIYGIGPENIIFPTNGKISNSLRDAGIVGDALRDYYKLNKNNNDLKDINKNYSGDFYSPYSYAVNGEFDLETFIGSANVKIARVNDKEIMVTILNITSLTSGDLYKDLPWNNYPKSVVRNQLNSPFSLKNKYGNISQTFSFTLPINFKKLKGTTNKKT